MSRIRRWRKLARIANRQGNQLQGINSDVGAFGSVFDFSPPAFAVSFMGMAVDLTEALLSKAAGWEAMKHARAYLSQGQVLSSYWAPPLLRGVVQAGETSFRASMVIRNDVDIENLCTCRESREWGKICAHSVAVGLHFLQGTKASAQPAVTAKPSHRVAEKPVAPSIRRSDSGQPAELVLILPPTIEPALERGKVMLVLEAQWEGGRCPLGALPKNREFSFSKQDNDVMDWLEKLSGGETPAAMQLSIAQFAELLPVLAGHPNLSLGKKTAIAVSKQPFSAEMVARLQPNGEIKLSARPGQAAPFLFAGWAYNPQTFSPVHLPGSLGNIWKGPITISRNEVPAFLNQRWPQLFASGKVDADFSLDDFSFAPQQPRFFLELRGGLAQLSGLLQCGYGSRIFTIGVSAPDEAVWLPDPDRPTHYSTRDQAAERAALGRLQRSGFSGPDAQGKLQLLGQDPVLNFFAREFPRIEREWTVTLEERLQRSTSEKLERITPRFEITSSGVQWFDLGVVFSSTGGEAFSQGAIQSLLLSGRSHTRLKNGKVAVIDIGAVEELQEVLRDCSPQQHAQGYRISNQQAGFLGSSLAAHRDWKLQAPAHWQEKAGKQAGSGSLVCPPLGELETVLRPYQKQGVAWLQFLRQKQFGGILADEMGLGKTLQALAFLQHVKKSEPGAGPMLVVCPTSLVFNWMSEAKRFVPGLKVLPLQGPDRDEYFKEIPRNDLVITSYALIRRDAERYREFEFDTVVLDEAQHIKNRQTQNAQAVKAIKSQHRLVLTGTPLENSVLDLWSIFDFLMPGYLGTAQDFRERYELPIARENDPATKARLARRLKPFLMRRLKSEVAADLPARLEQVAFCELTPEQRGVYQQLMEVTRKEMLDAAGEQSLAKTRMLVLTALLRLRQACCDLRLLKLEGVNPATASGKLELFRELLEEVIDGGHRVLVFSQFVTMLALLKERLVSESIDFCYLDGSTIDRAAEVNRFQTTPSIPVFLISLKAGGVGLNLTGADTVVHFDPWWNPAVEAQATDRAHRIGQTRVVTSYKLITRDTIEEKILTLQNRKKELIAATIGEEEFASSLSWNEIQELLS
ncbi:MAG TPA: SNF2-related protein [Verrucomicrobiae bacterium]|nr:SNF2-related protein [Verrucomicrobiae bacterium]